MSYKIPVSVYLRKCVIYRYMKLYFISILSECQKAVPLKERPFDRNMERFGYGVVKIKCRIFCVKSFH